MPIEPADCDEILARGLTEVLAEALARDAGFKLTELESVREAVAREQDPRAIANLLKTDHLLRGYLTQDSNQVTLRLELIRGADGMPEWNHEYHQPRDTLTGVLGPVLAALRRQLLPGSAETPVDPVLRATVAAQSLYLVARQQWPVTREASDQNLAVLERAISEDPGFALGWAAIANARRAQYWFGEASIDEAMKGAKEALDMALSLDPNLVEALVVACYVGTNQWRAPAVLGASGRALELAPNDAKVLAIRGNVLAYVGRPREALALHKQSVALNPLSSITVGNMAIDYLLLGQREQALAQLDTANQLLGRETDAPGSSYRARIELAFGNVAASMLLSRRPRQPLPGSDAVSLDIYSRMAQVDSLLLLGNIAEARREIDAIHPLLPESPAYLQTRLSVYWAAGRYSEAVTWLEGSGRNAAQHPWQTVAMAHGRALAGDSDGALADYASALEGLADRELVFDDWWLSRFGAAQLANWIALRKAAGLDYLADLNDMSVRLDRAADAGVATPSMDYYRALLAALRDDPAGADGVLTRARERGWFGPLALQIDLPWRPYQQSEWFARQRAALSAKAASERAILAAAEGERERVKVRPG